MKKKENGLLKLERLIRVCIEENFLDVTFRYFCNGIEEMSFTNGFLLLYKKLPATQNPTCYNCNYINKFTQINF